MKIKYSALVSDARGKLNGSVASKNRSGAYLRNKVTPSNPRTTAQMNQRSGFTALSQGWRGLTEEQRTAWNAAVDSFLKTNIFGDSLRPSGINLFIRLNGNLQTVGAALLTEPPVPSEVAAPVISSVITQTGAGDFTIAFTPTPVPAATAYVIRATAPGSAGKNFVKSEFRIIETLAAAATSPVDLEEPYTIKFGGKGAVGQKSFFEVYAVNTATGQNSTPSQAYGIWVAAV